MTYRDPAPVQCETCLNKKTRSPKMPMSRATRGYLMVLACVLGAGLLLFADIATGIVVNGKYGEGWTWAVCLPFTIVVLGVIAATVAYATEPGPA